MRSQIGSEISSAQYTNLTKEVKAIPFENERYDFGVHWGQFSN